MMAGILVLPATMLEGKVLAVAVAAVVGVEAVLVAAVALAVNVHHYHYIAMSVNQHTIIVNNINRSR